MFIISRNHKKRISKPKQSDDGKNAVEFITKCLKYITSRLNDENDDFLTQGDPSTTSVICQRGGKNRHIPVIFFHSILMLQSCKMDLTLSEAWFDATQSSFTSKLNNELGSLPTRLIDFLLGSKTTKMIELAVKSVNFKFLTDNVASWMYQEKDAVEIITQKLDKANLNDKIIGNKLLEKRLQIHLESGGKNGKKYLDILMSQSKPSNQTVEMMDTNQSRPSVRTLPAGFNELIKLVFNSQNRLESQRALRKTLGHIKPENVELLLTILKRKIEANVFGIQIIMFFFLF